MKKGITLMLCIGMLLFRMTPVFAVEITRTIELGCYSFKISGDWQNKDGHYYKYRTSAIPMLTLSTLEEWDTLRDLKKKPKSFIDGFCEEIDSPVVIIKMHKTSYADIPALTFSVYGTFEEDDVVIQSTIFENSGDGLVMLSYAYQDDNREFNTILESIVLREDAKTEEVSEPVTEEDNEPVVEEDSEAIAEEVSEPTAGSAGEPTMGEKNALGSAKNYLDFTSFSYSGLIEQLEFEGYSAEEAAYAADNCGADWNEQAAKSAEDYLDFMSFSRQGLIDQLVFDGFTQEQAEYGVGAVGY